MPPSFESSTTTSTGTAASSPVSEVDEMHDAVPYVPVISSLSSVYSVPDVHCASPGRVNLIGEHIDYSLFDVLPMAITQDVLIAVHVGATDGQLVLNNTDPNFPARTFNIANLKETEIDATVHEWSNYFLAGVKGAFSLLPSAEIPNMHCLIDGRIPTGSGLSSSSAFVCASLLAIVTAVKAMAPSSTSFASAITKSDLVQSSVVSERHVGVNSGGMDQSASVFGVPGHALQVHDGFAFVIANTLVVADKHVTGPIHYNLRVVETAVAAETLAKQCGLDLLPIRDGFGGTPRDFVEAFRTRGVDATGVMFKVKEPFQFRARALHVLEEAERVKKFCEMLTHAPADQDGAAAEEKYLRALASIMTASHQSCRDLFECSCEELHELVGLAVENGAYGSRSTGAGWGGATVSLVRKDKATEFVQCLKKEYYLKWYPEISEDKMNDAICITEPALGSAVVVGNYNV
ncbi:ribosomal protein S5 domain 2-type protein [Lipomyces mesembrius]